MINGLKKVLSSGNLEEVKEFISEKEFEYYVADGNELVDSYEDLEFQIPNYDLLLASLGIATDQSPIITDMYPNKTRTITNKVDVYATNIINCYLIRMDQFTLADDDGNITRIIFTNDIDNAMKKISTMLETRNIALESRKFFEQQAKEEKDDCER